MQSTISTLPTNKTICNQSQYGYTSVKFDIVFLIKNCQTSYNQRCHDIWQTKSKREKEMT